MYPPGAFYDLYAAYILALISSIKNKKPAVEQQAFWVYIVINNNSAVLFHEYSHHPRRKGIAQLLFDMLFIYNTNIKKFVFHKL